MTQKRCYSINLAATILTLTHLMPEILLDQETKTYYCVFPECAAVKDAIKSYREDLRLTLNIHDFLNSIKLIRTAFHQREEVEDSGKS